MVGEYASDPAKPCAARTASQPLPQAVSTPSGGGGCHSTELTRDERTDISPAGNR